MDVDVLQAPGKLTHFPCLKPHSGNGVSAAWEKKKVL